MTAAVQTKPNDDIQALKAEMAELRAALEKAHVAAPQVVQALPTPGMKFKRPEGFCPFGCHGTDAELGLESQFDKDGYCCHVAGTLNMPPNGRAVGKMFERLEMIPLPVRDETGEPIVDILHEDVLDKDGKPVLDKDGKPKQKKTRVPRVVHSGLMRINGKNRDVVKAEDRVVSPEEFQREMTWTERRKLMDGSEHLVTHTPRLGLVARIYRRDANTPVITKPQEHDVLADVMAKIEDKRAELRELTEQHAEMDRLRDKSEIDEIAEAEIATDNERRRMKETALVAK